LQYKLLALDLDGTLLHADGSIHERDLAGIARLQAAGVDVTIVTGRLYSGSRDAARRAGVRGPVACVDGSQIVDARDDRALVHSSIAGADAETLRAVIARHKTASFVFAEDAIVHDAAGTPFVHYVRTWSPNITVTEDVTLHPYWGHERGVLAAVAVGPRDEILAAVRELEEELAGVAYVVNFPVKHLADLHALVVRAAGPTKGTAIHWLAEHYGCTAAEVVAVGDWLNDLPMFEAAGRSFVMGHAPEAVKERATDRLEGTVGGGVAEAITRAWGA
jgi:hypothetical protein